MNSTPRPPTVTNTRGHPSEFQPIITEKSENFVGREFVFTAINEFLHKYAHGYFTLIGAPGSGKTAILAKYVTKNPHVIYYNAQVEGKNQADEFLVTICNQLIDYLGATTRDCPYMSLPDNATEGSWFLSLLLQKISDNLEPDQRLILAIDALDAIAPNSQPASSNLFYLPRYLPAKVYFLLTRRPFVRERSRLLIEAPSQVLNLEDYPEQNRDDVQTYIHQWLTPLTSSLKLRLVKGGTGEEHSLTQEGTEEQISDRISPPFLTGALVRRAGGDRKHSLTQEETEQEISDRISPPFLTGALVRRVGGDREELRERLIQQLTAQSENNFMYLSQILLTITQEFDSEPYQFDHLPPGLETYYQSHLQRMGDKDLSAVELGVLRCLATPQPPLNKEGISTELIAQTIDEDEYEVETILENWIEFLQQQQIEGETRYRLYHSHFRDWLNQRISNLTP
jgi:hypothetical protein